MFIMCLSSHPLVSAFQRRKCLIFRGGFLSTFGVKLMVYKSHRSGSSLRTLRTHPQSPIKVILALIHRTLNLKM